MLWTGLAVGPDGGPERTQLLSLAMDQLGLPNLWLRMPRDPGVDPLDLFFDLLSAAALRGEAPADGESLALKAGAGETKLSVQRSPSPTGAGEEVWSVLWP